MNSSQITFSHLYLWAIWNAQGVPISQDCLRRCNSSVVGVWVFDLIFRLKITWIMHPSSSFWKTLFDCFLDDVEAAWRLGSWCIASSCYHCLTVSMPTSQLSHALNFITPHAWIQSKASNIRWVIEARNSEEADWIWIHYASIRNWSISHQTHKKWE